MCIRDSIGTPADYLEANLAVLDGTLKTALPVWERGTGRSGDRWVGAEARVDGTITHSIVGANARVPEGARLEDCVVWDGVTVPPGDYTRCIFFDDGVVSLADPQ